jgi:hypothetical protein
MIEQLKEILEWMLDAELTIEQQMGYGEDYTEPTQITNLRKIIAYLENPQ